MTNNPFSNAHSQSEFSTRASKFDVGRVTQVKSHERGDKVVHYAKVKLSQMDVDREIPITVSSHGDVNPPIVDQYVMVAFKKGERPYIIGQYYPVEDSVTHNVVKNYEAGERILGHPETDASILFDTDGNILTINANEMNGGGGGGRLPNGDIREHSGTYTYHGDEDIFVHANQDMGGSVYGVDEPHSGVLQNPTSPQTEYVDLGFFPRRIEFTANLHQSNWNEPYYTVDDAGGSMATRGMAKSDGLATMTPLEIPSSINGTPDTTSQTNERVEKEPYAQNERQNPTQIVQSHAWFQESGTEYRSYAGDGQVARLIQGEDVSMTELSRVELRVNYFDDTGFEVEWFANNESGATYRTSGQPFTIHFVAYT